MRVLMIVRWWMFDGNVRDVRPECCSFSPHVDLHVLFLGRLFIENNVSKGSIQRPTYKYKTNSHVHAHVHIQLFFKYAGFVSVDVEMFASLSWELGRLFTRHKHSKLAAYRTDSASKLQNHLFCIDSSIPQKLHIYNMHSRSST